MTVQTKGVLVFQKLETLQSTYLTEVPLYFRNGAMDIDPKRGLTIHGPVDATNDTQTIRVGLVSNAKGIDDLSHFFEYFNQRKIRSLGENPFTTLAFPGFEKAFRARIILSPDYNDKILSGEVSNVIENDNPNLRIRKAAELYGKKISNICDRVVRPDVIICHKIKEIEENCKESRHCGLTKQEKTKAEEPYLLNSSLKNVKKISHSLRARSGILLGEKSISPLAKLFKVERKST